MNHYLRRGRGAFYMHCRHVCTLLAFWNNLVQKNNVLKIQILNYRYKCLILIEFYFWITLNKSLQEKYILI